ncbi:hypothetical protein HAZT_HAZT001202 [Hyalella azteca]|uniref:Cadherin domain-containing protein n=1 Tax=Hyalella azteca TaxID=294128 RepID=A0A6A0H5J5_HYAAZ|nr:hypothetical protein HAZT_HAZT001202 [Hyalella azteca]
MAVSVLMPLLIPLGEQITNVTQLESVGHLEFERHMYEVYVPENTSPVVLLSVVARTNTTNLPVQYSVAGSSRAGVFRADERTGVVTLESQLDYEVTRAVEVFVGAKSGDERAFCRVLVRVQDLNDHAPVLTRPFYETQVTEEDDRHLPKTIVQVVARDEDVSDADKLRYFLSGDGVFNPYDNVATASSYPDPDSHRRTSQMAEHLQGHGAIDAPKSGIVEPRATDDLSEKKVASELYRDDVVHDKTANRQDKR